MYTAAVGWLSDGRLILTLISVQQQHVQAMLEDRLGERYVRLDADWRPQGGLGIDVATPVAAQALVAMAKAALRTAQARAVISFLTPRDPRNEEGAPQRTLSREPT